MFLFPVQQTGALLGIAMGGMRQLFNPSITDCENQGVTTGGILDLCQQPPSIAPSRMVCPDWIREVDPGLMWNMCGRQDGGSRINAQKQNEVEGKAAEAGLSKF